MKLNPTLLSAAGLIGGYKVTSATKIRPLGGATLALAGVLAHKNWKRRAGAPRASFLTALYFGAFGAAHPLAKKIGAWPAVYTVAGVTAFASLIFGRAKRK
ncbi:MAG: hypothetical protein Q4P78_04210 [Rothia sp. (in: high G+C Gram-positive bacteria)]|uniref:hypothetical protein n=1 Tax=Rothia sp. (in: high G+C Gram-positive bacteria) TaxID=1885016 RepID=UPI0026E0EF75|nr:hypothetical protein [Rothia sp. (in: high G+C Gram-positive bacteria)]MDO5750393.1 hypothetical protein [Rothia sp. (in: high G+C Gram-positive bacteria)]